MSGGFRLRLKEGNSHYSPSFLKESCFFQLQCVNDGLVILVIYISDSASDVTTEDNYIMYKSKGRWSCEIFFISLSIHGFHELKPCINVSSNGDICVCFSKIRKTMRQTQEQFLICC